MTETPWLISTFQSNFQQIIFVEQQAINEIESLPYSPLTDTDEVFDEVSYNSCSSI
jgi:hypothetical protein